MNILGLSCFYHDAAACLIKDGQVMAAAQEERFDRVKGSSAFPIKAIDFCLKKEDLTISDLNYVVFYEKPYLKFERVILDHLRSYPFSLKNFLSTIPNWLQDRLALPLKIKEELGYEGKVLFVPHHLSHAASTFFVSPFKEAAIITADGVGEWTTATVGVGRENKISIMKELRYPNSLGLLYTAVTTYLGFKANTGEGKVMAFAALGKPIYLDKFKKIISIKNDGSFKLDQKYFGFCKGTKMYSDKFIQLFGKERIVGKADEKRHYHIAASLQAILEEILLKMANFLYQKTRLKNLCLAGGTFLNCVANSRILKETRFQRVFIQPAAGDAGGALGAAVCVYHQFLNKPRSYVMKDAYLGPLFTKRQMLKALRKNQAKYKELTNRKLIKFTARKVFENKIVGWFQGAMEFGPRALCHRTILANASYSKMKDLLNEKVKHREWFRPYGIIILREKLKNYFDADFDSPYMILIGKVKKEKEKLIPSALHVNGTSRLQTITKEENGTIYDVVKEFERIFGIPLMINTSFNDKGEPIVCTPDDAYNCFVKTKMDYLVLGNYVVEK